MSDNQNREADAASASANRRAKETGSRDGSNGTRERLRQFANTQKDTGAEHVSGFAKAAHKAAENLQEQNPGIAGLMNEAADGLDQMASKLRERDVSDIYGAMQDFARRQPVTFFLGSMAAGVLLARFLKSSAETDRSGGYPYHSSPKL
jgi:hypothetical protein